MNKKICVMTGTRAEYGLLRLLLFKLKDEKEIDLRLLVTGAHLSKEFGNTQNEILEDGFVFDRVAIPVKSDSKLGMACNTGEAINIFSHYLNNLHPDMLILLGDRYEAFAAATAAYILSIPIAHISGGDVTEGALDEGFRHCITKMSMVHFPGCDESAKRIVQMGEQPQRVFCVGDPGVENCLQTDFWEVQKLEEDLKFSLVGRKYGVVTFHPVTQEDTAVSQLMELIKALDAHKEMQFIITIANADAGGRAINKVWGEQMKTHKNWLVVPSLGHVRYLSAVRNSTVVIGNSSSGIVEAPVLGVPVVNIGDRQKGRMLAECVINCNPTFHEIDNAITKAVSNKFKLLAKTCESPFGKGDTSNEIVKTIKMVLKNGIVDTKKRFYDIDFEV